MNINLSGLSSGNQKPVLKTRIDDTDFSKKQEDSFVPSDMKDDIEKIKRETEERLKFENETSAVERIEKFEEADEKVFNDIKKNSKNKKNRSRLSKSKPEKNEDYYSQYLNRIANNRRKKAFITGCFVFFISAITILNIYFIFFREVKTTPEIASEVVKSIGYTTFPKEGVQGYLNENIYVLMEDSGLKKSGSTYEITDLNITNIMPISNNEAIVMFTAYFKTDSGNTFHNFMITLEYDSNTISYAPTGNIVFRNQNNYSTSTIDDDFNSILSFEGIDSEGDDEISRLTPWIENFFVILYNQQGSVNSYYDGSRKIGDSSITFDRVNSVQYYSGTNKAGYNCLVNIRISDTSGLEYDINVYMTIEKLGEKSYMIHTIS